MNHREIFNTWKRHKERFELGRDFPERVMAHIRECQISPRVPVTTSASLLGRIVARPWAKAAVVILGVLIGLLRIVMTLDIILRA